MTEKEGKNMAATLKRLTFVVTKEMERLLAKAKEDRFDDRTQSDMIRKLLLAGLNAWEEKEKKR